jgi:hypothetical protein
VRDGTIVPPALEGEDPPEALPLERLVTGGEDLVEEEDVRVQEGGNGKAEAHRHPRRVGANRPVDRILELGERDDLVEPAPDLGPGEPLDCAVQEDVLATSEVRVEPGAELEQRIFRAARGRR